jgi:threonine dehydrogenase-like Zn-dependent dehydrogenase
MPLRPPERVQQQHRRRKDSEAPRLSLGGQPVRQFINISSYAEKMLLHENSIVRIDPDIPLDKAALVGCGVLTGVGAACAAPASRPGRPSRFMAAAGSACRSSRARGSAARARSSRSTSSARSARWRCASARRISSIRAETDPVKAVRELTGGAGVDHAFEAVGNASSAARRSRAWRSAAPRRSSACCRPTRRSSSRGWRSAPNARCRPRAWARTASGSTSRTTSNSTSRAGSTSTRWSPRPAISATSTKPSAR